MHHTLCHPTLRRAVQFRTNGKNGYRPKCGCFNQKQPIQRSITNDHFVCRLFAYRMRWSFQPRSRLFIYAIFKRKTTASCAFALCTHQWLSMACVCVRVCVMFTLIFIQNDKMRQSLDIYITNCTAWTFGLFVFHILCFIFLSFLLFWSFIHFVHTHFSFSRAMVSICALLLHSRNINICTHCSNTYIVLTTRNENIQTTKTTTTMTPMNIESECKWTDSSPNGCCVYTIFPFSVSHSHNFKSLPDRCDVMWCVWPFSICTEWIHLNAIVFGHSGRFLLLPLFVWPTFLSRCNERACVYLRRFLFLSASCVFV